MFLGYSWCSEGSSHSITSALRRGVERYGPPESIYVDNGKDYLKVAKGAMPVPSAREWPQPIGTRANTTS